MDEISKILLDQIKEIDARDETQILSELAGETVSEMIYETKVKDRKSGKMVPKIKLSWAGTKEAARSRGNIMVDDYPQVTDTGDGLRIIVKVHDIAKNFSVFGGCHQPYRMKVYDYDDGHIVGEHFEDDPYCFQKGLSKAQRNAFQTIMSADLIAKCANKFLVATGQKPAVVVAPHPAPKPKAISPAKNREGWEAIKQEDLTDYNSLEKVFWNLAKKQPAEMYKELGVNKRMDLSITPWEAFLQLKTVYCQKPPEENHVIPEENRGQ